MSRKSLVSIQLPADPSQPLEAATKQYVDAAVGAGTGGGTAPVGTVSAWAGLAAPSGWLLCDGSVYNVVSYPVLGALVTSTYGGNGVTTFAVPDLRNKFVYGYDPANSVSKPLNATGGAETVALATAELASHAHTLSAHSHTIDHSHSNTDWMNADHAHTGNTALSTSQIGINLGNTAGTTLGAVLKANSTVNSNSTGPIGQDSHFHSFSTGGATGGAFGDGRHYHNIAAYGGSSGAPSNDSTSAAGSGTAHQNMPPFRVLVYIIKAVPGGDDKTGGATPIGPAGGDLTGTYPNPTIGTGKITSAHIADGTIQATDLAAGVANTPLVVRSEGFLAAADTQTINFNGGAVGATQPIGNYVTVTVPGSSMQKDEVRATTTGNITLSGTQTVDGVALVAGDRVLVKDQTAASANGIYQVAAGAWARTSDADGGTELARGSYVSVLEGTLYRYHVFTQTSTVTTIGTDAQQWRVVTYVDGGGSLLGPNPNGYGHMYADLTNQVMKVHDGSAWVSLNNIIPCTSGTRPAFGIGDETIIYETDTSLFYMMWGGAWKPLGGGGGGGGTTEVNVSTGGPATRVGELLWVDTDEPGDFVDGPRGQVAYAQIVANVAATNIDVPGLAVTFTAVAGRRYKCTVYVQFSNTSNGNGAIAIMEGATQLQVFATTVTTASQVTFAPTYVASPSAGVHTWKVFAAQSGGSTTILAGATSPSFILVEDIGAA